MEDFKTIYNNFISINNNTNKNIAIAYYLKLLPLDNFEEFNKLINCNIFNNTIIRFSYNMLNSLKISGEINRRFNIWNKDDCVRGTIYYTNLILENL